VNDRAIHHDFLSGLLHRALLGMNRGTHIDAQLDIEVDMLAFHVFIDGDSAVISFGSFSDAYVLYKMFAGYLHQANDKELCKNFLRNLNITIYLQNRHAGIIGPNASPVLSRLFKMATYLLEKKK
jgi:hypothetical protein